jgi:poly-gamma-glutamate capsule biosynthesis protein CapA/YwtB (metallophosphatase superfamily)
MTGRGIDQILAHPSDPRIYEMFVQDARTYVELAEEVNGPIPRPVDDGYIWGDALTELQRVAPDARIVNLETTVTRSDDPWPKGINYRMHPANVGCLTAAGIDVCSVANNHVLDYRYPGLGETLLTLRRAGVQTAGAGQSIAAARQPAVVDLGGDMRVVVHAFGTETSGILPSWAAGPRMPGVAFVFDGDLVDETTAEHGGRIRGVSPNREITIASIHWGSNWGYEVPPEHVRFAHRLVDAGVDIVHGHSSHHPRPIEVYRNRLILYGCGDFINDYEGISGHEEYRADLTIMYIATLDAIGGDLAQLRMTPMQIRRMRLNRPAPNDTQWLGETISRISADFGSRVEPTGDGSLLLRWE